MKISIEDRAVRKNIGIITGSGPEAGVDMWVKVLRANKKRLGPKFRGDLDAPPMTIVSEPNLGLSMEMDEYSEVVWEYLEKAARTVSKRADCYAIACNTLNYFADRLEALDLPARLVSFVAVVAGHIRQNGLEKVSLLGATPVMSLGRWSPYRRLSEVAEIETPPAPERVHQLIYDIKVRGPEDPAVKALFHEILADLDSEAVLLACTELPLVQGLVTNKRLVDVTDLVAAELVERSFKS